MLEPFQLPFVQRGLVEVLILAVPAGLLGTWIVLRGLAFFTHAVGTAAFPGLVLAEGLAFSAPLGAFGAALAFTGGSALLTRDGERDRDSVVALVLVACLAGGIILASDVFRTGSGVESLLFGSLLLVDGGDIALAALSALAALAATVALGERWLVAGFDDGAPGSGPAGWHDALLLVLVALAATAALTVVGALLVSALFVLPALTARFLTTRLLPWQLTSIGLVAIEGTAGLWLSVKTDAPPGATIACVAGGTFAVAAAAKALAASPRRTALALAGAGTLAVLGAGIAAPGSGGNDGRLDVVATTTILGDLTRAVGGDAVSVDQVLQPNTDPHAYEPRPSDILAAAGAEVVFASGDGLDPWARDLVEQGGGDADVVDLGAGVPHRLAGEDGEPIDPHWWHDPRNVIAAVGVIERRLSRADPARAAEFRRNSRAYTERVRDLDRQIAACMATVPAGKRALVTDHDAFGYFAHRYGIDVVGAVIPAQTTQAQASAKDLSELAAAIRRTGASAVFPEASVSPRVAQAIARETGARSDLELYGDTLGAEGSPGATYLGMEAANANAMIDGFTGGEDQCRVKP